MQRYVPDEPWPSQTYIPGRSQPRGLGDSDTAHSDTAHGDSARSDSPGDDFPRGGEVAPGSVLDPVNWQVCRSYLVGIDLFNAGYYWESHELWEAIWHAAGRRGTVADFVKGLIKLAAAGVKVYERRPVGVQRHLARAAALFSSVQQSYLSLDAPPVPVTPLLNPMEMFEALEAGTFRGLPGSKVDRFAGLSLASLIATIQRLADDPATERLIDDPRTPPYPALPISLQPDVGPSFC